MNKGNCGGEFRAFDPEESFAKSAEEVLKANRKTAENKSKEKENKEALLESIMKARDEAENSGDYAKVTELVADLVALAKFKMIQQVKMERAK